jgi:MFS superfamily sulfate permease-like transporter
LSTLAGVLVVVCWNMAEKEDFLLLLRDWRGGGVLIATFGLTLIEDLTFGIIAGCMLASAFAIFDRVKRRGHSGEMPECDRAYEFVVIESRPLWNVGFWQGRDKPSRARTHQASNHRKLTLAASAASRLNSNLMSQSALLETLKSACSNSSRREYRL